MAPEVRRKGFSKFVIGLVGAIAVGFLYNWLEGKGYSLTIWGLIAFGLPGAYAAAGLLEMATGIPFTELATKWDELKGWQRGINGIVVVDFCLGMLVGGLALWGSMTI